MSSLKATISESGVAGRVRVLVVFLVFGGALPAVGQEAGAAAQGSMPAAAELVARHVEQVNAKELLARGSLRTVSQFSMPSLGMTGDIIVVAEAPDRMALRMTLPGLGEIASGYDGTTGWSMNPMEGPRVMSGEELAQIRDEADFDANTRDTSLIASMETVERTEIGGTTCWKVRLEWKSGRETFDCYGVDSGYLVATMLETQTAMGAVASTITFDEYTDYDGVKMPRVSRQQAFGQEMVVTLQNVEYGGVESSAFELPAEIKALIGK